MSISKTVCGADKAFLKFSCLLGIVNCEEMKNAAKFHVMSRNQRNTESATEKNDPGQSVRFLLYL